MEGNIKRNRWDFQPSSKGKKKYVTVFTPVAATQANLTTATLVNTVAQDNSGSGRIGRAIRLTNFKLNLICQTTTTAAPGGVRLVVFVDKQPKNAAFGASPLINGSFNACWDPDQAYRYEVLHDSTHLLGIAGTAVLSAAGPMNCKWELNIPLNHDVIYTGAAALIANVESCALYQAAIYSNVANTPVTSSSVLEFEDI